MRKEVRWTVGNQTGIMFVENIPEELKFFEKTAKSVLKKNGADHVIYASKVYDKNNELEMVHFYNPPLELSNSEFEERTKGLTDYIVYSLHKKA